MIVPGAAQCEAGTSGGDDVLGGSGLGFGGDDDVGSVGVGSDEVWCPVGGGGRDLVIRAVLLATTTRITSPPARGSVGRQRSEPTDR